MDHDPNKMPRKLWEHSDPKSTAMWQFMQEVNEKHNLNLKTFRELYKWSIKKRSAFYAQVFDYLCIIHTGHYTKVVDESLPIDAVPRWFEGVHLNWAETMLYSRQRHDASDFNGTVGKEDSKTAVTEVREGNSSIREWTWGQIRHGAGRVAASLKARGVRKGDRVVLVGANSIETLLVFLGVTWLGGLFSSSSTDMGTSGILQRTTQIDPKFIFFDDAALYNGKVVDLREKMAAVEKGMEYCADFEGVISIPRFARPYDVSHIATAETWDAFLESGAKFPYPAFERIAFHEPFVVYYSSGTTGTPKAIVHSVGGCVLNLLKEGRLHGGISSETVALQYTTTGWIMYLAAVSALVFGARAVLYDGSPFQPDLKTFIKIMGEQKITKLGTSPRWMFEVAKNNISPREVADLSTLKIVTSTGMVLSDQLFEWFYDKGFPPSAQLANISGGTDIAGCFGLENPLEPVYVGGTQGPSLGVEVAIYDSSLPDGPGKPVPDGTPGELVAPTAFPNIPCFLWGDSSPSTGPGPRYRSSYFSRFNNVWVQGDFCEIHPRTGNIAFLGRADGVLNPSGIRFGSAEVYAVIERNFADKVVDSLCVGRRRKNDADESVMLFLLMKPGARFSEDLVRQVKERIGKELTKRHVPKFVFETPEIPTTVNLKKVELPVKRIISGHQVKASGTLLNPQSLEYYYQFANVEEQVPKAKL